MNETNQIRTKNICRELKKLVTKFENNIKEDETQAALDMESLESLERPPAGITRIRPDGSHNYWSSRLRIVGSWHRTNNY
jgi:hypothetical protein